MLRLTKNVNGLNQQRTVKSMKNYSRLFLLHLIALFGVSIPSLAIDTNSSLKLQKGNFKILLSKNEMEPVKLAAKTLCKDFEKVMHYKPEIFQNTDDTQQIDIVIINEAVDNPLFQSRFIRPLQQRKRSLLPIRMVLCCQTAPAIQRTADRSLKN